MQYSNTRIRGDYRKRHVHRVLTYDNGQYPAIWTDDIAFRNVRFANLAGNRRGNLCIAKIDLRRFEIGLVSDHLSLR